MKFHPSLIIAAGLWIGLTAGASEIAVNWAEIAADTTPVKGQLYLKQIQNTEAPNICRVVNTGSKPPSPFGDSEQGLYIKAVEEEETSQIRYSILRFDFFGEGVPRHGAAELQFYLPEPRSGFTVHLGGGRTGSDAPVGIRLVGNYKARVGDIVCEPTVRGEEVQTLRVEWDFSGDQSRVRYFINDVPVTPSDAPAGEPYFFPLPDEARDSWLSELVLQIAASPPPSGYFLGKITAMSLED